MSNTVFTAKLTQAASFYDIRVEAFADGESIYRWGFSFVDRELADRLVRCIEAGQAFRHRPESVLVVDGIEKVIKEGWAFKYRTTALNTELKRAGF